MNKKRLKKGDCIISLNNITNSSNELLFEKGKEYVILYVNNESIKKMICLNSKLYSEEFELDFILKNFKKK